MEFQVTNVQIQKYIFAENSNPFAFDAEQKQPLNDIAFAINEAIEKVAGTNKVLVRGVQSRNHTDMREKLISKILQNGSDNFNEEINRNGELFAAPYNGLPTIEFILAGFHEFKPKCEELPHYPVDVWMIFNESAFTNIEYIHPRHNTKANDKWQRIDPANSGLVGLITIN